MKKQKFKREMCKMLAMATLITAIPFNTVGVMAAEDEPTFMSETEEIFPLQIPKRPAVGQRFELLDKFDLKLNSARFYLVRITDSGRIAKTSAWTTYNYDDFRSGFQHSIVSNVKNPQIVKMMDVNGNVLTLTTDGNVYYNSTQINALSNIVLLSEDGKYAINKDGEAFLVGTTSASQIQGLEDIVQIDDGVALKSDGTVWTWGKNDYGQLGNGDLNYNSTPIKVNLVDKIVDIKQIGSSSVSSVYALTENGDVYAWGANTSGQLGVGSITENQTIPKKIALSNVVQIQDITGDDGHSGSLTLHGSRVAFITHNGSVYRAGRELVRSGGNFERISTPRLIPGINSIKSVYSADFALYLINEIGDVYSFSTNTLKKESTPLMKNIIAGKGQYDEADKFHFALNSNGEYIVKNYNVNTSVANHYEVKLSGKGLIAPPLDPVIPTDTIAPSISIINPKSTWVNQDIELAIQANDGENGSGIKSITLPNGVVVNSIDEKQLTMNTKYTVSTNGTYEFTVEDNAGNVSTKSIDVTNIDKVKPSLPSMTKLDNLLSLTKGIDELSGIDKHMYSLNDGVWTEINGDLNLSGFESGDYSIKVKAIDKATNESDIFSLSFTVESTSNPDLDNAKDLVEKAEDTKDQTDVDNARDAVDKLPEGPEKDDLNDRLDKIQEEIDSEKAEQDLLAQATAAVEKAESTKLQADIDNAYKLVKQLKPSQAKNDLLARLDALKKQVELDNALAKAIAAVVKAEETEVQIYVDVAYTLVERLPASQDRTDLLKRLDELQLKIYYKELLAKATKAVERAEKTRTETDINNAYDLVNQLKESPEKTDLLNRLQAIKDAIQAEKDKQANMLAEAITAVEKAESTKSQIDVDSARTKVNELPRGTERAELTNRLNAVQDEIDYALKVADAIRSVERAESTESSFDISNAYKKANGLKDGETKTELLNRLKMLEQNIAQKAEDDRIAKEAIKAVERAELTKKPADIENAKNKVALVKDDVLREELEERLLAIELAQEEVKEAENLKEAERLVRLAEIFKRNPHLMNAKTAVNKLSTSEAKLALQARLDAIEGKNGSGVITEEMKKEMTAESTVEKAEKYKYATLIRQAIKAVDELPESPKKQELQARIDVLLAN